MAENGKPPTSVHSAHPFAAQHEGQYHGSTYEVRRSKCTCAVHTYIHALLVSEIFSLLIYTVYSASSDLKPEKLNAPTTHHQPIRYSMSCSNATRCLRLDLDHLEDASLKNDKGLKQK